MEYKTIRCKLHICFVYFIYFLYILFKYMIILNKFNNRLGNNINQLSNLIDIALYYKHNIKFNVNHNLFDLCKITNYFKKYKNDKKITDKNNFFYTNKLNYPIYIYETNAKERNKILKDAFLIKNIDKLNENYLIIHIRSGDIFRKNPHSNYVPPPLSYYMNQINIKNYEKIIIVSEDTINPVVNKLLQLYKNAIYNKNTLEKDIKIILGATNVVFSVGTFVPSLLKMSNNIKYVYGKDCNNNELKDYYKKMKPWKNTHEQRNYILTYNLTNNYNLNINERYNNLFGDPCYRKVKQLIINYVDINDKTIVVKFEENKSINLNYKSIIKAEYGCENKYIDVTHKIL